MRRIFKEANLAELLLAGLLFVTALMPLIGELITSPVYALSNDTRTLVGSSSTQLDSQLTYNATGGVYQFNAAAEQTGANPGAALAAKVGTASNTPHDSSPYSLDIPQNFSHGVTYHDTNSGLGFSLIPQFSALDAKLVSGHLVFPLGGGVQAIYTLKNNGLKEDIVIPKVTSDTASFSYKVSLPKTLAMRIIPNSGGAIGVYAADPALYGNVQYGSSADKTEVEKIRETAPKTSLVFGIPAPVVKDTNGARIGASAFDLTDSTLTIKTSGLSKASGPITIDPSVVITSTSDFQYGGTNEGMIDFSTSGQINRGGLTGGDIGAWATTTALGYNLEKQTVVAYNGYLYSIGGNQRSPSTNYATISYAAINSSNGTIGTWNTTTNTPQSYSSKASAQVYNGYLYLIGGAPGTGNGVYSVKINSDGTLGTTWSTLTVLPTGITDVSTAVYSNYIYVFGGNSGGSTPINNVYYAALNADGTIGSWTSTTVLSYARAYIQAFAYNGYVYILGGANSTPAYVSDVQYAKINSDGSLGSWMTTNSFTNARYQGVAGVYNGYVYYTGGIGASRYNDLQYAPINTNGSLGTWTTSTNAFTTARTTSGTVYNGYIYIVGGYTGTADLADVQYAKVQAAGTFSPFATLTNSFTTARALICSVVLNGYLYAIGGSTNDSASNNVTTVQYTAINATTGNNGAWSTATVLPIAIGTAGCTTYNNYLYIVGGETGTGSSLTSVYYTTQGTAGALNSWTAASNVLPQSLGGRPGVFTYANTTGTNIYTVGGCVAEGNSNCSKVYYSTLNASTGAPGTWTTSANNLLYMHQSSGYAQVGKYLYGFGGSGASGVGTNDSEYAVINSDGSVGTWTAGGTLPSAVGYNWGTTVNGCVYSVGGEVSGTSVTSVFYGCPSATGAITWSSATSLPTATTDMGVTSANGYLYGVGGFTTAVVATTLYARVNNGGSGLATGWASTGTTSSCSGMSTNRSPVAYKGYVYITGAKGSCGDYYAPINGDGTVGAWTAATNQETSTGYNNVNVVANGYLYSIGGYNGTSNLGSSNYAAVGSSGAPGTWNTTTAALGTPRNNSASAVYNGYIYVIGGDPGETVVNYAKPTATGDISAWSTGTTLPDNRYGATAVAYGGYLYVIGGGTTGTPANTVIYAPINTDGSLGSWVYTASITGAQYTSATALNGYIYVMGGATASTNSQMAVINSNGSLGPWQQASVLSASTSVSPQAAFTYNGWIYLLSNGATGAGQDMFYYSPMSSINRIGHYSKLLDLGSTSNITGITFTGTIPYSSQNISYRGAPSSTAQFGATNLSSTITTPAYCGSPSGNIRYLWLWVTLDDSTGGGSSGLFPDANNAGAVVQDMTINYNPGHPVTNTRLRSGQTLQTGVLSPLDTCAA